MERSVGELAKDAGISVRTLRYYDQIGLLRPARVTGAGYRCYDAEAASRLTQILFYRELGFSLCDIADILSRPDYDKTLALARRREILSLERERIEQLMRMVDEAMEGKEMEKQKVTSKDVQAAREKYGREAAEKWGKTAEYAESEKRLRARGDEGEAAVVEEGDAILAAFAAIMDQPPDGAQAQALVEKWREHITRHYYPCKKEILSCLGMTYTQDERFRENIDRFGDGNAKFISEAIAAYCAE